MCKTVTNTITFCHTRALGMQIQRDTINNRKRKKKGKKENRTPFLISMGKGKTVLTGFLY